MSRCLALLAFASVAFNSFAADPTNWLRVDYDGFSVWLDCDQQGLYRFAYSVTVDTGYEPRLDTFSLDSGIPAQCQPTSADTFKAPVGAPRFDRGHMVPANHMDGSALSIAETNFMTNVLPQTAVLNRGAWLATEEIIECYRDLQDLQVIGGAVWGRNKKNDYFVESHGIKTPDYFWKIVIRADGQARAWYFPNNNAPIKTKVDRYLISIARLEKRLGETFPVMDTVRKKKYAKSWPIPTDCNKG